MGTGHNQMTADPRLTDFDVHLLLEGSHYRSYEKLGAHPGSNNGNAGVWFAVWAPAAKYVSVVGEFNRWDERANPMQQYGGSGFWQGFVPGAAEGALYKYYIVSSVNDFRTLKADPFAFFSETPPCSASIVRDIDHFSWKDQQWMSERKKRNVLSSPLSIYELQIGSWKHRADGGAPLTYREIAAELPSYVKSLGFTHVELMPIMEYPQDASWGYQTLAFYAPTSRYGTPDELMLLIDSLHRAGIGVILDWAPARFPTDGHGLGFFDGSHLYEHADPRQGFHPEWGAYLFNYGRREVSNYLIANALFWLERYHADGLRIDCVASILYQDFARKEGEWVPNQYGGRENLDGIQFLRRLNETVYGKYPDIVMVAEESSAWPMVSRPTFSGGLGFGLKWNNGWTSDVTEYIVKDPVHRSYHHNNLTHNLNYAFQENFLLALSHEEIVRQKSSLLGRLPGDAPQKFANLRILLAFLYGIPGKKLLFMGGEFGQWREWDYQTALDWDLLRYPEHHGTQLWVRDLNRLYCAEPAMHEFDCDSQGFSWVDCHDNLQSVVSFLRYSSEPSQQVLCIYNFTPVCRANYRVGVGSPGYWEELLNSDGSAYGGGNAGNSGGVFAEDVPAHGRRQSLSLTLPPLGALFLKPLRR